ncbi:MAG: sigma-54-dependent Fis family transcriptional regulator [Myxococcaceae bacterium]|nr:sigma-54-dependent Fis family transcriptional regulator [Myxococcaceae bacterium]
MEQKVVLVVDDEEALRTYLAELLQMAGYQVRTASGGQQALQMLAGGAFDAVLLDVILPDLSGLEVLKRYRADGGTAPVIVLSALAGADDAVRAMKFGATDYIAKPFNRDDIEAGLARAFGLPLPPRPEENAGTEDGRGLIARPSEEPAAEESTGRQLIYISSAMRRAKALVDQIADTDVPVLLLGESGVGKEVIAREIHQRSRRRARPFIKVNCAALPAELLESELFGHERGAFTGATAEKPGKFELADQGTIFLDEIGEMAIRLQAKLLQVLQDEEFFRVGGKKSVRVDARVVVATNRDLEREIEFGNFREDLFYRLNVVAIRIAPLRERREDIAPLVEYFLKKYSKRYRGPSELPQEVMRAFLEYDWPGNVRELENLVRRLVVLNDPGLVLDELRAQSRAPASAPSLPTAYAGDGGVGQPRSGSYAMNRDAGAASWGPPLPGASATRPADAATPPLNAPATPSAGNAAEGEGNANVLASPQKYMNPFAIPQPPPPPPEKPESEMSLKDIGRRAAMLAEREAILAMLQRTAWNKRKAASKLKISYKALLYKIKECGIVDPRSNAEF